MHGNRLVETFISLISTFCDRAEEEDRALAYTVGHDALCEGIVVSEVACAFCVAVRTLAAGRADKIERRLVFAAAKELRADLLAPYALVA